MSQGVLRCVVPPDHQRAGEYIKTALVLASEVYKKLGCSGEVILVIPKKERYSAVETALGKQAMDILLKKGVVGLQGICDLRLESVQTIRSVWKANVVVAVFAYQQMLDEIDRLNDLRAIVVAPDLMEDISYWTRTWNPSILGQESSQPEKLIENPIFEEALKMITEKINLSTGLSHPRDHDFTVGLLRYLKKYMILEKPSSVRAWAVRNGWSPDHANDLASIVRSLAEGRRIRGGKDFHFDKSTLKMLRDRAEGK